MRTCGACHECCVHVKMDAFQKPAGVPCQHLAVLQPAGCCGCYEQRPSECRTYACAWLEGFLPDALKPDACGLLFERAWLEWPRKLTILMGFEHRAGAIDEHEAALDASAVGGVVIGVAPFGWTEAKADRGEADVTYFGEEQDLAALARWMDNCRRQGSVTHKYADRDVTRTI